LSLNKKQMVRQIGRRTGLKNREVQLMLETLIDVWTEALVSGGRIEIEHFLVIDVQTIEPAAHHLLPKHRFRRIAVRVSNRLRKRLNR
jgi:hypothetical protein